MNMDKNYDDTDETQNELRLKERGLPDATKVSVRGLKSMPLKDKFKMMQEQCKASKLPPPLPFAEFDKIDWDHVSKTNEKLLMAGYKFKTPKELGEIARRHPKFPYCHPGPVVRTRTEDWYYADSIVQEVKYRGLATTFYNVRWIGYEDNYNTLESEASLMGTAVLVLFKRQNIYPAAQATGVVLLRRSTRNKNQATSEVMVKNVFNNGPYDRAMVVLNEYLKVEERAGRYLPEIGFYSVVNATEALKYQLQFTKNVFLPLIEEYKQTNHTVSQSYIGTFVGNAKNAKAYQQFKKAANTDSKYVSELISGGKPQSGESVRLISFFVPTKRNTNAKVTDKNLDLHINVYTVRSKGAKGKERDSVFFDSAPPCFTKTVTNFLRELRSPLLQSATQICGEDSQANDCLYQCFKYLIGLVTGETELEVNVNSKYFVINLLQTAISSLIDDDDSNKQ